MSMVNPNIFRPRNDWNVISLRCKKPVYNNLYGDKIAKIIHEITEINPFDCQRYRGNKYVQARQIFMVMMEKYTKMTYRDIAMIMGKDHANVNYSKKTVSDRRETDRYYRERLEKIEEKVKAIMI